MTNEEHTRAERGSAKVSLVRVNKGRDQGCRGRGGYCGPEFAPFVTSI